MTVGERTTEDERFTINRDDNGVGSIDVGS